MSTNYRSLNFCLYNSETEQLVEALAWEQFRSILRTLKTEEHDHWYYWHETLENWHKVEKIIAEALEEKGDRVRIPPFAPAMPRNIDLAGVTQLDINKDKIEKRTTRRFHREVQISIEMHGTKIKTSTINISIGGAMLKTKLPDGINTSFKVYISLPKKAIHLEAVVIENAESGARIRFLPTEDLEDLRDFLLGI